MEQLKGAKSMAGTGILELGAWITATVAGLGVIAAAFRKYFSLKAQVNHNEEGLQRVEESVKNLDTKMERLHDERLSKLDKIDDKLDTVSDYIIRLNTLEEERSKTRSRRETD